MKDSAISFRRFRGFRGLGYSWALLLWMLASHVPRELLAQPSGYPHYPNQSVSWLVVGTGTESWNAQEQGQKQVAVTTKGSSSGRAETSFIPTASGSGTISYSYDCFSANASVSVHADGQTSDIFWDRVSTTGSKSGVSIALSANTVYWVAVGGFRGNFTVGNSEMSATVTYPAMVSVSHTAPRSNSGSGTGIVNASEGEKNIGGFFAPPQAALGGVLSGVTYSLSGNNPYVVLIFSDTRKSTTANASAMIIAKTVQPPVVVTGPQSQTVVVGASASFRASASGAGPLSYTWYFNANPIPGANSSELSIASTSATNAGIYSVVISNMVGAVVTSAATLTVVPPPSIAVQPQSQTTNAGASVTFGVSATGTAPLTFFWSRNGSLISGANQSTYTVSSVQFPDSGSQFGCVVSNLYGSATSQVAVLTVLAPPTIIAQPQNLTTNLGALVTFSVSAMGTAPLTYFWSRNGSLMSGPNQSNYGISNVLFSDSGGRFGCVVSNAFGSATSEVAVLTVLAPPGITDQPQSVTTNVGASVTFGVAALGTAPLGYLWSRNGSPVSGANQSAYAMSNVQFSDSGSQFGCVVSNGYGWATSQVAVLTVLAPPGLADQPQSVTTNVGASVTFRLSATGTAPLSYCWSRNGSPISDAGQSAYTVSTVQLSDSGSRFCCVVSNAYGSVTSQVAVLTVSPLPQLSVGPPEGFACDGNMGGPFTPGSKQYTLNNSGGGALNWTASADQNWVTVAPTSGLNSGIVIVSLNANASSLGAGSYRSTVTFGGNGVNTARLVQLTVGGLARAVRIVNTNGSPGKLVSLVIELISQGNENAIGLSLDFAPADLAYRSAGLAGGLSGGQLLLQTNQLNLGRLGLTLALSPGQVFQAGTQQVFMVNFEINGNTTNSSTPLVFGNQPVLREVDDVAANSLAATYADGSIAITLGSEADVSPRPGGNGMITLADWVQVGRFYVGLDTPSTGPGGEFQRADCAPRTNQLGQFVLGDGKIGLADWVQAGRYYIGLDPLTPIGGPTDPVSLTGPLRVDYPPAQRLARRSASRMMETATRVLELVDAEGTLGAEVTVPVRVVSLGNENAFGFSVNFDARRLKYRDVTLGCGAAGSTLLVITEQAGRGEIGISLAKIPGESFKAGVWELVRVTFTVGTTADLTAIGFSDVPLVRETVDALGNDLSAAYGNGMVKLARGVLADRAVLLSASPMINGTFALRLAGEMGRIVELQVSEDCAVWVPLTRLTLSGAAMDYLDASGSHHGQRYYRAVCIPAAETATHPR